MILKAVLIQLNPSWMWMKITKRFLLNGSDFQMRW
jgi:hypothetical protein